MKTSRFLLFLSLASIVSCSPKKDNPADSSQSASVGQELPLERYLTFQLKPSEFFPINDWIKFSKDSPQLAGIFNLVGNHNDTYNYSFEINAPNEKARAYGTKLILHIKDKTISFDKSSVIWGQEVTKAVEYCKTRSPIIKPEDCITFNHSRFLYEQDTFSFEMPKLSDPDDAWIGLQLTFANDVADTQKVRLMIGDVTEDGSDMIVKEGQILGYGCRSSTPWPGCPSLKQK